jgi:hypothetical protein
LRIDVDTRLPVYPLSGPSISALNELVEVRDFPLSIRMDDVPNARGVPRNGTKNRAQVWRRRSVNDKAP